MDECEWALVGAILELEHLEEALRFFACHGGLGENRDTCVDFDSALHGLDVVELHNWLDVDILFAEESICCLASWNVWFESDKLESCNLVEIDGLALREWVLWADDENKDVVVERDDLELFVLLWVGDESEVDRVGEDVFVNVVRAAILDADIDLRVFGQEMP